jgi:hypothetical protein
LLIKGIDRDVIDSDDMTAAMLATVCQQEHCAQLINECKSALSVSLYVFFKQS